MSKRYLSGDEEREIREELRFRTPADVAAKLGMDEAELRRLLHLPAWKSEPAAAGDGFDLWSSEDVL